MSDVLIEKTGLYSSIQDLGRFGYKQYGVPESGFMDAYHGQLANMLVGNDLNAALIENAFGGLKIRVKREITVVVTGAVDAVLVNGVSQKSFGLIALGSGDVIELSFPKEGVFSYLAIRGGIQSPVVMKSRSQFNNITLSAKLNKGDDLEVVEDDALISSNARIKRRQSYFDDKEIEVMKGPEFDDRLIDFDQRYQLSESCNRQGYLVKGIGKSVDIGEMLTSAVMPGTVQLTRSGQLNILMKDAQTTGGYPRVLQLTEESIGRLAQKRPNQYFVFRLVD